MFSFWLRPVQLNQRSKLAQTASALKSVPSWNLTPSRRVKVCDFPSGADSHSVASSGSTSVVPGAAPTRPSNIWRATRKVSPSLARAGSSISGSEEAANTNVLLAPPSLDVPSGSRWLCAHDPRVATRASEARPIRALAGNDLRSFNVSTSCYVGPLPRVVSHVRERPGARVRTEAEPETNPRASQRHRSRGRCNEVVMLVSDQRGRRLASSEHDQGVPMHHG